MDSITAGKTAAIIAEYNPFHNGHQLHISRTRELLGAAFTVIIMSGNFVQRGECAVADKFSRTRMALAGGADLVLELPLPFACAGAEKFAMGGVEIADALGCVDYLSFGMECDRTAELKEAANALSDGGIKPVLDRLLAGGMSFASARTEAVRRNCGDEIADILCSPNNTLAVEYIRALDRLHSDILPAGIQREGAAHDSDEIAGDIASATAVRKMISEGRPDAARRYIPPTSFRELECLMKAGEAPADMKHCERAILSRLRSMTREQLSLLPDISEGLENRIFDCARSACSLESLYDAVKSKRYSHARIRRIILSAFLGIREEHSRGLHYIRILGMNEKGKKLLSVANPQLPLISSYRQAMALPEEGRRQYLLECHADDLWGLMTPIIQPCGADMTAKLTVI
ncbi:MAG: nucleotidyltransferase family protein [Clostridia bacterium]|nr:nucleotidyltransferase family protein [Clostridia bacterium]